MAHGRNVSAHSFGSCLFAVAVNNAPGLRADGLPFRSRRQATRWTIEAMYRALRAVKIPVQRCMDDGFAGVFTSEFGVKLLDLARYIEWLVYPEVGHLTEIVRAISKPERLAIFDAHDRLGGTIGGRADLFREFAQADGLQPASPAIRSADLNRRERSADAYDRTRGQVTYRVRLRRARLGGWPSSFAY